MSYNNIIKGDGDSIISLNYLYNPRNYFKKELTVCDVLTKLYDAQKTASEKNQTLLTKCIH